MHIFIKAGILAVSFLVFSEVEASDRRAISSERESSLFTNLKRLNSVYQNILGQVKNLQEELEKPYIEKLQHEDYLEMQGKNALAMKKELEKHGMDMDVLSTLRSAEEGGWEDLARRGVDTENLAKIRKENYKKTYFSKLNMLRIAVAIIDRQMSDLSEKFTNSSHGDELSEAVIKDNFLAGASGLHDVFHNLEDAKIHLMEIRNLKVKELKKVKKVAGNIIENIATLNSVLEHCGGCSH